MKTFKVELADGFCYYRRSWKSAGEVRKDEARHYRNIKSVTEEMEMEKTTFSNLFGRKPFEPAKADGKPRGSFKPRDEAEHERAAHDADVPDYCANCGAPFMDHYNGRCPRD